MAKGSNSRGRWLIAAAAIGLLLALGIGAWQIRASAEAGADANNADGDASLTQDPNLYQGDTKQAYLVAREHPELLAQLDCYCGCEQHEGHKNLLDCFRTNHGAGC